jgi:hypothetical protein
MQKLYCYVDESGQDTAAQSGRQMIFVVTIAIFSENRVELEKACEQYERQSGKTKKWNSSRRPHRMNYLRRVLNDERFRNALCFSVSYPNAPMDYDATTISAIANAIHWKRPSLSYTAEVYIDGMTRERQASYAAELRRTGVRARRVHRARDESYALIRLADALAGFIREGIEDEDQESKILFEWAKRRGMITLL